MVHLGVGNFHRAHQAWYTAHAPDADEWGIAAFTGRRPDMAQSLAPQDGLYTLITRSGDGEDAPLQSNPWLEWNPHLRFQNNLRGYVRARITPTSLDADFRALRKVTRRDQQVFTRASVAIADQEPGVHLTADNPA